MARVTGLDPRIAVPAYVLASLAFFWAEGLVLVFQILVALALVQRFGGGLAAFLRGLGVYWLVLASVLFLHLGELFFDPDIAHIVPLSMAALTLVSRLLAALALYRVLSRQFTPTDLREGLAWYIARFSQRIAADFSLSTMILFSALPLFVRAGKLHSSVLKARGIRLHKAPVKILASAGRNLLSAGFSWANAIVVALTLRGYSDAATLPPFDPQRYGSRKQRARATLVLSIFLLFYFAPLVLGTLVFAP